MNCCTRVEAGGQQEQINAEDSGVVSGKARGHYSGIFYDKEYAENTYKLTIFTKTKK
jgi:hypothetical protein